MADKMMRIAGRTSGGTAVPMLADTDGNINVVRKWTTEVITLYDGTPTDTSRIRITDRDVSNYPVVSLRASNATGVNVRIELLDDMALFGSGSTTATGEYNSITIPSGYNVTAVLPTDLPILSYLKKIRAFLIPTDTPNGTGKFQLYAVVKY